MSLSFILNVIGKSSNQSNHMLCLCHTTTDTCTSLYHDTIIDQTVNCLPQFSLLSFSLRSLRWTVLPFTLETSLHCNLCLHFNVFDASRPTESTNWRHTCTHIDSSLCDIGSVLFCLCIWCINHYCSSPLDIWTSNDFNDASDAILMQPLVDSPLTQNPSHQS